MSFAPLRVGIVGCGAVAERYHLPALTASPDVAIVAVADPGRERAAALAARVAAIRADAGLGIPRIATDHAELIGHVDAVVLAAPNAVHAAIASDLLEAGIHVLVEKPMARTAAECDRMIAAAAASGAVLAVGHDFRHFPVARFARSFFHSGMLGPIRRVDVRQSVGGRWPYASPAVLSPAAGGGALIDFGVHLFDLLLWWLGELRPVRYLDDAAGGIEGECEADLELPGGVAVRFELSRVRTMRDTVLVEGERGTIELGVFEPAVVRLTMTDGEPALVGSVPDEVFRAAPLRTVFARQLADFVVAVREGCPPLVSGADGRRAVALVEACYALKAPLRHPWDYPEAFAAIDARIAS